MDTDVLIVGAGSAGSVLAERISADPDCRVTLLESGPAMTPELRALTRRAAVLPIGPDSPVARRYRTELTRSPAIARDIVRGACVGGSGAANGGYFCRALPGDFDEAGVPGWSWADVEPHYRAIETDLDFPDPRGGGPIPVRRVSVMTGPTAQFATAVDAAGLRWLPTLDAVPTGANAPPGIGAVPCNVVDGIRVGPGVAFLEPVRNRPNLTVLTATRATRVLTTGGRTTGVEAVGPGGPMGVSADRVVLCAGAIESAHLLMLSGIGPAEDLSALGIPVTADLPVGRRSWDHPEWLMSTTWDPAPDSAVLEAVLVTGALEIRPYTKGFAAMGGAAVSAADPPHIGVALMRPRAHGRLTLT
ncbi:MAG: mycofactocin dehydrogenase MftG, partial [Mycobacterium sp.]